VVPDNMVVIWPEPLTGLKAFHTPLQPVLPTMVMEYVSESNKRKDYDDNFRRYRDDLHVPYYLLFDPELGERVATRSPLERSTASLAAG